MINGLCFDCPFLTVSGCVFGDNYECKYRVDVVKSSTGTQMYNNYKFYEECSKDGTGAR